MVLYLFTSDLGRSHLFQREFYLFVFFLRKHSVSVIGYRAFTSRNMTTTSTMAQLALITFTIRFGAIDLLIGIMIYCRLKKTIIFVVKLTDYAHF